MRMMMLILREIGRWMKMKYKSRSIMNCRVVIDKVMERHRTEVIIIIIIVTIQITNLMIHTNIKIAEREAPGR